MRRLFGILLFLILSVTNLFAHDGHSKTDAYGYLWWIGNFHPLFLQFPIVLTVMTGIAELICYFRQNVLCIHAARFMLLGAAIMVVPTVLFGLALGYKSLPDYNDLLIGYVWWHGSFGILSGLLIIATAYSREYVRNATLYYVLLTISICSVVITGFLGGSITFGPYALIPPVFN